MIAILLALLSLLCFAFPAYGQEGTVDVNAEAERFARELLEAHTPAQAETVVVRVLERVGIGVYDAIGNPVVVGNEEAPDAFYLYDFEVRALATLVTRGRLVPLHDVVYELQTFGIHTQPGDAPTPLALSSAAVERALRALRAEAERDPTARDWFLILLIDALGDREEFPFSLLEEEESELGFAATAEEGFGELLSRELQVALEEALADGDAETAQRIAAMMEGEGFEAVMQAMLSGNIAEVMQMMAGEEAIADLEEGRRELRADAADAELEPEVRAFLQSTEAMVGAMITPGHRSDIVLMETHLEALRAQRDLRAAAIREGLDEWEYERRELRENAQSATALYGLASLAAGLSSLAWQHDELEVFREFLTEHEAFIEEGIENQREAEARALSLGLPWEEDEERSNLMLDPVQALLVAADLLLQPRQARVAASRPQLSPPQRGRTGTASSAAVHPTIAMIAHPGASARFAADPPPSARPLLRLPPTNAASDPALDFGSPDPCHQIGRLQSAYPDAFGLLEGALGVGRAARSTVKQFTPKGVKGALEDILRGIVNFVTIDLQVTVRYLPDDSGGAPGGGYIHQRHYREENKRIEINAELEDLVPNLLPGALRDLADRYDPQVSVCGFLKDIAGDLGGAAGDLADLLSALERLLDGQDFAGTPVLFEPTGEAWDVLEMRPRDWDAVRAPTFLTFINRMGEDGRTTGVLYPSVEQPDIGGRREVVRVPVRVQAVMSESPNLWRSYSALGLRVLEETFQPVQRWVPVYVERHVPTPISGRVEITRTVTESGSTSVSGEAERSTKDRHSSWTVNLRLENARLASPDIPVHMPGVTGGTATLHLRVSGDWNTTRVDERLSQCNGRPTWLKRTEVETGNVISTGSAPVAGPTLRVASRSGTYALNLIPSMVMMHLAAGTGGVTGGRDVDIERATCDGTATESFSDSQRHISDNAFSILTAPAVIPLSVYREFPRGAGNLSGSVTWNERIPADLVRRLREARGDDPEVTFQVTTTVTWQLRREP